MTAMPGTYWLLSDLDLQQTLEVPVGPQVMPVFATCITFKPVAAALKTLDSEQAALGSSSAQLYYSTAGRQQ